jgi:hypothetical protein
MSLLEDVHMLQQFALKNSTPTLGLISITRKTRSWDFMPPDIVRPVASTTIGCLIAMAHRLGMAWIQFGLDEGRLRASGNGRSFSATTVRGMGLVVEYNCNGSEVLNGIRTLGIPSADADKLRLAFRL